MRSSFSQKRFLIVFAIFVLLSGVFAIAQGQQKATAKTKTAVTDPSQIPPPGKDELMSPEDLVKDPPGEWAETFDSECWSTHVVHAGTHCRGRVNWSGIGTLGDRGFEGSSEGAAEDAADRNLLRMLSVEPLSERGTCVQTTSGAGILEGQSFIHSDESRRGLGLQGLSNGEGSDTGKAISSAR